MNKFEIESIRDEDDLRNGLGRITMVYLYPPSLRNAPYSIMERELEDEVYKAGSGYVALKYGLDVTHRLSDEEPFAPYRMEVLHVAAEYGTEMVCKNYGMTKGRLLTLTGKSRLPYMWQNRVVGKIHNLTVSHTLFMLIVPKVLP
jgi:hypothetical protein